MSVAAQPPLDVWETMRTATTVRRYRDEPVSDEVLERCLLAATWAPSGGNQQPWKFVVLRSAEARAVVTDGAVRAWNAMIDFYNLSLPEDGAADRKSRALRTMAEHTRTGGGAPALVMFCIRPQEGADELQQGGSIFPAVQNFLLAARAQGLGAAITLWHYLCEAELRAVAGIPDGWQIAALLTVGWPKGRHHPVRRKPLSEVAVIDHWDKAWQRGSGG